MRIISDAIKLEHADKHRNPASGNGEQRQRQQGAKFNTPGLPAPTTGGKSDLPLGAADPAGPCPGESRAGSQAAPWGACDKPLEAAPQEAKLGAAAASCPALGCGPPEAPPRCWRRPKLVFQNRLLMDIAYMNTIWVKVTPQTVWHQHCLACLMAH
ncbi:unnamed protein product [Caretta caretta]